VWAEVAREIFLIAESLEHAPEGLLGLSVGGRHQPLEIIYIAQIECSDTIAA